MKYSLVICFLFVIAVLSADSQGQTLIAATIGRDLELVDSFVLSSKSNVVFNHQDEIRLTNDRKYSGNGFVVQDITSITSPVLAVGTSSTNLRATSVSIGSSTFFVVGEFDESASLCETESAILARSKSIKDSFWAEYEIGKSCPIKKDIFFNSTLSGRQCSHSNPLITSFNNGSQLLSVEMTNCQIEQNLPISEKGLAITTITPSSLGKTPSIVLSSSGLEWKSNFLVGNGVDKFWIGGSVSPMATNSHFIEPKVEISKPGIWICEMELILSEFKAKSVQYHADYENVWGQFDGSQFQAIALKNYELFHLNSTNITKKLQSQSEFVSVSLDKIDSSLYLTTVSHPSTGISPASTTVYLFDPNANFDASRPLFSSNTQSFSALKARISQRKTLPMTMSDQLGSRLVSYDLTTSPQPPATIPTPVPLPPTPAPPSTTPSKPPPTTPPTIPIAPITAPAAPIAESPIEPTPVYSGSSVPIATRWALVSLALILVCGVLYLGYRYWMSKKIAALQESQVESLSP